MSKKKITKKKIYLEQQTKQDCVVHAFNNMMGGPKVSCAALVDFINRQKTKKKKQLQTLYDMETDSNFSPNILHEWYNHRHKQVITEVGSYRQSTRTGKKMLAWIKKQLVQHKAVHFDRFMASTISRTYPSHGHAICVKKIQSKWYILDSEFPKPLLFSKHVNKYKQFASIRFIRKPWTKKELEYEDEPTDMLKRLTLRILCLFLFIFTLGFYLLFTKIQNTSDSIEYFRIINSPPKFQ